MHLRHALRSQPRPNRLTPVAHRGSARHSNPESSQPEPLHPRSWVGTLLGLVLTLQLGAVASLGAAPNPGASDPRLGSWIGKWMLTSAQSSLDPANKLTVTPAHGAVHVAMTGETHFDFTVKPDGHETSVPGNPAFNRIELRKIDRKQTEVTEKKDGILVATIRNRLSNDGKELTIDTMTVGHPDQITVWTRTGGARSATDPLAGEWTEDLGKTRLRQGLIVKIEADGSGAVRFSGDFSYTARFDGKPYDLKNSRNDDVTLQLVDPYTVDATYRRDGQVAQKDRWVVSADRQQMTLSSTGSFETGQRFTEKLVFKRQ